MMPMTLRATLATIATTLLFAGCPDTQGGFDDFGNRTADLRAVAGQCTCDGPGEVDAELYIGVGVVISPDPPILLQGTFVTDTTTTPTTISASLTILNKETREKLDNATITATADVAANGSYELDFGDITVPGDGNPITGSDIPAVFRMCGCTSDPEPCGFVDGTAAGSLALTGSNWGSITLTGGEDVTALETVSACPEATE